MKNLKRYRRIWLWSTALVVLILILDVVPPIKSHNNYRNTLLDQTRADSSVKPMIFYLHNDTKSHLIFDYSTTYIMDTNLGHRGQHIGANHTVTVNFYLFPPLAGNLSVKGNITVGIYINATGSNTNGNLNAKIYDVKYKSGSTSDEVLVGTGGPIAYTFTTSIDYYDVTITGINYTFNTSDSIRLYIEIQGGTSTHYDVWYGNDTYDARMIMDCANYMNIKTVKTKNYKGNYTIFFDPNANNKTLIIESNITDPFGGYDIVYANVTLVDPYGNIVVNNKSMKLVSGTPVSYVSTFQYQWNYSGYPKGEYHIYVWTLDNNGYYYYWHFEKYNYGPYDELDSGYFVIGFKYKIHIWVYDAFRNPLKGARVCLIEPSGASTDSNYTNQNGYTLLLAYNGTYILNVRWNGNLVTWSGTEMIVNGTNVSGNVVSIRGESTVEVYADVGDFEIQVLDSHHIPVRSALIFVGYPNGTYSSNGLRTNDSGFTSVGYSPGGKYHLSVYWKNVEVYSGEVTVHFSVEEPTVALNISTSIYYLTVQILDNQNVGVPYLQVIFYNSQTQLVEEVSITNENGSTTVRLPAGDKDIVAYFQDQKVYSIKNYSLNSDATLRVHGCFYTVNFHVIDSHNIAVSNATVLVIKESKIVYNTTTDLQGSASLTLIKGNYTIRVIWLGVTVNESILNIQNNMSVNIKTVIYYLTVKLQGNDDKAVNGHIIIYSNNRTVVDGCGDKITARLPVGTYIIKASISKTMYMTYVSEEKIKKVNLTGDCEITPKFEKYPVTFFGSTLFYVILGYLLLIVAIVIVLYFIMKRKRGGKPITPMEEGVEQEEGMEEEQENIDESFIINEDLKDYPK